MEKIFLSYTYAPHPDHTASLARLHKCVTRAIEAMGLRIIDGLDLGGHALDDGIRMRIRDADALIALVTPQQAVNGAAVIEPGFVLSEFHFAEGVPKPTMRVWHHLLNANGLGAGNEYALYTPGNEVDVILKLMNTIAVWKREYGKVARVRIEPDDLAGRYDETQGDRCYFQRILSNGTYENFVQARLWQEPGAAYALLPKLREGERVRLRLEQGGKTWQSRHAIDPFIGGVSLEVRP